MLSESLSRAPACYESQYAGTSRGENRADLRPRLILRAQGMHPERKGFDMFLQTNASALTPLQRQSLFRTFSTLKYLGVFEVTAGILVTATTFYLITINLFIPGWYFPVESALIAHFAGVPALLAAGWVACALRTRFEKRWLQGAITAGGATLVIAISSVFAARLALPPMLPLVAGVLEAVLVGFWLADTFGGLQHPRVLPTLAVEFWAMLVTILIFESVLAYLFPMMVALLVSLPLLSAALSRKLDVPNERVSLPLYAWSIVLLPIIVAIGMIVGRLFMPL